MFDPSREDVRRFFCDTWRKHGERLPLSALEAMALDWILQHPGYHALLATPGQALAAEFGAERGNPFLHLSLHLALAEQLQVDQPPGIRAAY